MKSVGKRRSVRALESIPYSLPDGVGSLRQLIENVVRQEVDKFNTRGVENMLVPFLTETDISDQSAVGKVGFGRLYSEKTAEPEKAVATALQGFEDGLFRVVANDEEITEIDAPLIINENDVVTFIRLTFLAGRLW